MIDDIPVERLLTAEEVAEILNVSPSYAYELMQERRIKTVRLGRRAVRVRPVDLREFIDGNVQ